MSDSPLRINWANYDQPDLSQQNIWHNLLTQTGELPPPSEHMLTPEAHHLENKVYVLQPVIIQNREGDSGMLE